MNRILLTVLETALTALALKVVDAVFDD